MYITAVCIFVEASVRAPFAGRVKAVAIVEENYHCCRLEFDDKLDRICGNNYFPGFPLSLQGMSVAMDVY